MEIRGELITLLPYTRENCHDFYRSYVSDPLMWDSTYVYNEQQVNSFYDRKVMNPSRRFFSISLDGKIIGEIQLKYIDFEKRCGTLSIHLQNDSVKGKGYGTEAEKLLIDYAFYQLKFKSIYADAVLRNLRSQHVLEKVGFKHTYDDEVLRYYIFEWQNFT